jgi:hypothetical protein
VPSLLLAAVDQHTTHVPTPVLLCHVPLYQVAGAASKEEEDKLEASSPGANGCTGAPITAMLPVSLDASCGVPLLVSVLGSGRVMLAGWAATWLTRGGDALTAPSESVVRSTLDSSG